MRLKAREKNHEKEPEKRQILRNNLSVKVISRCWWQNCGQWPLQGFRQFVSFFLGTTQKEANKKESI